jgi:hypothetical protein
MRVPSSSTKKVLLGGRCAVQLERLRSGVGHPGFDLEHGVGVDRGHNAVAVHGPLSMEYHRQGDEKEQAQGAHGMFSLTPRQPPGQDPRPPAAS